MTTDALRLFGGIAPRIDPRLLPDRNAQLAVNVKTFSGKIKPFAAPLEAATPTKANPLSIFRMDNGVTDFWLNWLTDVNVVRGPIAGDVTQRIYYTGDGEPRVTNFAAATSGGDFPSAFYVLGVPKPTVAPTVGFTGGVGANETRVYRYTLVDPWGQEGQPSAVGTATGKVDSTSFDLSAMDVAPNNAGTITAVSSSAGVTTYTMPAGNTKFLRVGEQITIANIEATVNGRRTLTEVTSTTVKAVTGSSYSNGAASGTWDRTAPWLPGQWKQRIYRADSAGQYRFVAEQNVGATFTDNISNANLSLSTLDSTSYAMPPTTLTGLVDLPNGSFVAFTGNDVYFSEPYRPWAWPVEYIQTIPYKVTGLGVDDETVIVPTNGIPYRLTGGSPSTMQTSKAYNEPLPCLSKRTIVSTPVGVMWDTNTGLALSGSGQTVIATRDIFTVDEWGAYRPTFAGLWQGRYLGFGPATGFWFDRGEGSSEFFPLSSRPLAVWQDDKTGSLYLVIDGKIKKWDASNMLLDYDWWSKVYVERELTNYAAAKVDADFGSLNDNATADAQLAADIAYNLTILAGTDGYPHQQSKTKGCVNESMVNQFMVNGSALRPFTPGNTRRLLTVSFYVDGQLRFTKDVMSNRPFRLPSGFKGTEFSYRFSGNLPLNSQLKLGTSMRALQG